SLCPWVLASTQVPLTEVIEPLDFEDVLLSRPPDAEPGPLRELVEFPADDLELLLQPRECRTTEPGIPEDGKLDAQVRAAVEMYTEDWVIAHRRTEMRSAGAQRLPILYRQDDPRHSSGSPDDTPRSSGASGIFDLRNLAADSLLPSLLERAAPEDVDRRNEALRRQHRPRALLALYPAPDEDEAVERCSRPEPPREHFGQRILVKCLSLKFEIEIEPIFGILALYDVREKKKISENFYFDLNSDSMKGLLRAHGTHPAISTLARSAIFSVTYPSPDIFLVIKLEKVLQQGDISECCEPYMVMKEVDTAKFCTRLGRYRMPFAWTASADPPGLNAAVGGPRTGQGGSLQEAERLSDEDLFKFLADMRRPTSLLRRLRPVTGAWSIVNRPAGCPVLCKGLAVALQLHQANVQSGHAGITLAGARGQWIPLLQHGRLRTGPFCLPVSVDQPPPSYSVLTPDVALPGMRWVDGHKGVFSVELTAVSSVRGGARAQESGPGVGQQFPLTREAWLRAIGHDFGQWGQAPGKLLTQAGAAVPVAIPAGALAFDPYLDKFFTLVHVLEEGAFPFRLKDAVLSESTVEQELRASLVALRLASPEPLVAFSHHVLDKLVRLVVRPPIIGGQIVNLGRVAFEAMAHVVSLVHRSLEAAQDARGHCPVLAAYVYYAFRLPGTEPSLPGGAPPVTLQPATLARGPGRPASLYLARSKSISSSNPDLAVAPGSVDDEVSRILASKVGQGAPALSSLSGHGCQGIDRSHSWVNSAYAPGGSKAVLRRAPPYCGADPRQVPSLPAPAPASFPVTPSRRGYGVGSSALCDPCPCPCPQLLHEELALQWVVSGSAVREAVLQHAWFFFQLMSSTFSSQAPDPKVISMFELSGSFRQQHFLAGLLLTELALALDPEAEGASLLHKKAISAGPGQRSRLASMLDSDTEGEGDIGGTINPSVAMAIAGGPLAPGSRASISQGPATFPELLFEEDTELCADLCLRLLRHCGSRISAIRTHASASLYLLMRQNFEIGNNFSEDHLRRSLKTILTYAEEDVGLRDSTFAEQVQDLMFNLHMILTDTVKMKEHQEDPEMLIDLMYRTSRPTCWRSPPSLTTSCRLMRRASGGLYEAVNEVYKTLIPILEAHRDYKKLAASSGWEEFYTERFGEDVVQIIKDSNPVDKTKLDPQKAYIQITYVEPHFDTYELKDRVTYFDRNYGLRTFLWGPSCRGLGWVRTSSGPDVCLLISTPQTVLTPVEVAIEDMQKKTRELAFATEQDPPDAKMLQMVLQGSVGPTVNQARPVGCAGCLRPPGAMQASSQAPITPQGPLEVAQVFLAEIPQDPKLFRHHNKLRLCFKDFCKKCEDALRKNKALIGPDQKEYHRELERNYSRLREALQPLLTQRLPQLLAPNAAGL
ncbi:hypothetical protein E2I00_011956, partial [Balaenoptera physalus]